MKALVLGVNGYIGQHLAHYLQQKGWLVKGYDVQASALLPDLAYEQLDVTDKAAVERIDTAADFIFYFSGITGTIRAYDDYDRYIDVNEKGLLNVLTVMRHHKSQARIIFPSTRLVYKGVKGKLLGEDAEKEFKTVYALNKWFGECVLKQYSDHFQVPYTIYRICIPYASFLGKGYSYGTVGFFLNKSLAGEDISLYGDGEQRRTFSHVEDICQQIYMSVMNKKSINQVFNIGGENLSLREVAGAIADVYGVKLNFVPWPAADEKLETGDTVFDSTRIESLPGVSYLHSFKSWLAGIKTKVPD